MLEYTNKLCLAPMVRSGELPMRLLALKYGADLVWTPELVDKKIILSKRIINTELTTIDYVAENHQNSERKTVIFRKHPNETGKLVFQMGSSDPELAVEAAKKVIDDVDGIDLNCGCPKNFSTHSGMGAELLKTPEKLCSILTSLVENVGKPNGKPISCKIRLFNNFESSKALIEKICTTGITNLTIHCRTPVMRNRQDPVWNFLPKLIPIIEKSGISVVLNGNFQNKQDLKSIQQALNNDKLSIMFGEAAESNPSVFSDEPVLQSKIIQELYDISAKYYLFPGTKYMMLNMINGKSRYYQAIAKTKDFEQMRDALKKISGDINGSDKLFYAMNRDCQKAIFLKPEDLAAHLEKRHKMITNFFTAWDESTMLQDFDDQPTPKRPAEQQQQQQLETKRQKKQRKKKNKNNAFDKRRESVKA
ncbi:tRNA-dihydrouridine(20) synthase [NAD(P)+] [Candida viswanathii]|uniref:tRNA-dihydrouridine(20) synthase [NAD(P)+] n=1 Tax=Candida viswanathii TaxID=5486 RepID=A0A367XLR2_9ASCO|nr:tRNA-dihydrouridine(20) synthase [NAD(P)+] [Candida viswanathii]